MMEAGEMKSGLQVRAAGGVLAAVSILSVLVMAHHPTGADNAPLARSVHGAMMILVLMMATGYAQFAAKRDLARLPVMAGMVFYGAGANGNLLAATINGFAVPALIERGATPDILAFAWELNQALAFEAVFAISAAFAFWGADLFRRNAPVTGIAGIAAGLVPAALLASGAMDMHVAGAFVIYGIQAAFGAIVGVQMIRRVI
jgi:hypothetical protein